MGDFYSGELRTLYCVSQREGKLMLRYPRGELELKPVSGDVFSAGFPVGFRRSAARASKPVAVTTGRVRNLQFQRMKLPAAS